MSMRSTYAIVKLGLVLVCLLAWTGTGRADETDDQRQVIERLRRELAESHKKIEVQAKEIQQLKAERNSLRDRAVAAETAMRRQINKLEDEMRRLTRELAKATKDTRPAAENNPPSEQVEGLVKKVDKSGLLTLNLGTDTGLKKGQALEVYRLRPIPVYLGRVRIVEVSAKESVAQMIGKPQKPIQVGDQVASKLLPTDK